MNYERIDENKNVALVRLNQTRQTPDKINIVRYYKEDGDVDFILAIGKGEGFGPNYYSIVQEQEETLVVDISDRLSDVSTLSHSEKALCYCNPNNEGAGWYILTDVEEGNILVRHFENLDNPGEKIFRNLSDGFRWFYVNGVLKREDDFLSESDTEDIVTQNIEYFKGPTFDIELDLELSENQQLLLVQDGNNYYLPIGVSNIEKPKFSIHIYNYKMEDVTDRYTISLESGESLELMPDGRYMVWGMWENDFNLVIQATKDSFTSTETLSIWFPEIAMYGGCIESTIDSELIFNPSLEEKPIYHDLRHLNLNFDLDNQKSILLMPQGFGQFSHIYDCNGLDYIKDYTYHSEGYIYQGVEYPAYYIKDEPIVGSDFKQRFTFISAYNL